MSQPPNEFPPAYAARWEALADMERAGGVSTQIALNDLAWEMVEEFARPGAYPEIRLSNAWLGDHGWKVQLVPQWRLADNAEDCEALAAAAVARGKTMLLGTTVGMQDTRPAAVWRVPTEANFISLFFHGTYNTFQILYPEDCSFAVLGNEGDYAYLAGPEDFLRDALPAEWLGAGVARDVKETIEREYHAPGAFDHIAAHYAPFQLP